MSQSLPLPSSLKDLQLTTLRLHLTSTGLLSIHLHSNKVNSMTRAFWAEYALVFETLRTETAVRVVVVSGGESKTFTAGLDLKEHADAFGGGSQDDVARAAFEHGKFIRNYQRAFISQQRCPQPVVVAVHGSCVGGGMDLICCADIRLCSEDAVFSIKEADLGLAADVGTLQHIEKVTNNSSTARELCYTARTFYAQEALQIGLVSKVFKTKDELLKAANELAQTIASKSPVAIYGTKTILNYSRDHSVADSLEYQAVWNSAMLQTSDIPMSIQAFMQKQKPTYSNL